MSKVAQWSKMSQTTMSCVWEPIYPNLSKTVISKMLELTKVLIFSWEASLASKIKECCPQRILTNLCDRLENLQMPTGDLRMITNACKCQCYILYACAVCWYKFVTSACYFAKKWTNKDVAREQRAKHPLIILHHVIRYVNRKKSFESKSERESIQREMIR